jgi:hypothetical protein
MGLAYSPLALIVLRDAPGGEQGSASAAISLTDTLGTALGIGVTGALIAAAVRGAAPTTTGLALGFAVAIGVGVIGALLSWRLRASAPPVVASTPVIATPSPATGQDALVG